MRRERGVSALAAHLANFDPGLVQVRAGMALPPRRRGGGGGREGRRGRSNLGRREVPAVTRASLFVLEVRFELMHISPLISGDYSHRC